MVITAPGPEHLAGECPYCHRGVKFEIHNPPELLVPVGQPRSIARWPNDSMMGQLAERGYRLRTYHCPLCSGLCIELVVKRTYHTGGDPEEEIKRLLPRDVVHEPPPEVTNQEIRRDYGEAHACIPVSKRGAAALARRALQQALRDKGFIHQSKKLFNEIEVASKSPDMPTSLREKLHFIRDVGNDAAHPNSDRAGEIVDVTDDELTMLLESLDEFFDVFYVRPARHKAVMDARNVRVKGKP